MRCHHRRHFNHWMRHVASVPKGFLRYHMLKLLKEKPRSGSEIMSELEELTEGHWKPSPGSIYPLLAWLQDKGYTKEVSEQVAGMKRYTLTEEGQAFLEEHTKRREELRKRFEFFKPPFQSFRWLNSYPEKTKELLKAGKEFVKVSWNIADSLRKEYSEEAANEAKKVIEQAAERLKEIAKTLKNND